jgi:hypothetical protein
LKDKVDEVLAKGAIPEAGKWNNHDLNVMIQWFNRDGDKSMPKNKECLLLHYHETYTRDVHTSTRMWLPRSLIVRMLLVLPSLPLPKTTPIHLLCRLLALKILPMFSPTVTATTSIITTSTAATTTAVAIVVDSAPTVLVHQAPPSDCQPNASSNAPPLDGGVAHFDVGAHLNMEAAARPLCCMEGEEKLVVTMIQSSSIC